MRIVPLITAILVGVVLYGIVIERDRLLEFAQELSPVKPVDVDDAPAEVVETDTPDPAGGLPDGVVAVFARHSVATEVDSAVILRGETEALRQVDVNAETTGRVISEPLRRGSFVETGQIMCELDPGTRLSALAEAEARLAEARARRPETEARIPEAQARLEQTRAALTEAQINENAAIKLKEDGFASETRVAAAEAALRAAESSVVSAEAGVKSARGAQDSLEASIESAQASVNRAQTDMDRLKVVAPFGGLLETDTAELGSILQSSGGGQAALCATVIQLNPIKLVGYVPETQVSRIKVGAPAAARLTGDSQVFGNVTFLSRSADTLTRTFRVEIEVENPDLAIRDGQTAEIGIEADGAMAHLLPQSVLTLNDEGIMGVRVIDEDSTARFLPVTLARDTRGGVVLTGLPNEVDVITVGQEYVTDGVRIAPTYEEVTQ